MKLKYLGHAAFQLDLEDGRSIVFDPYEPGSYDGALGYGPIEGWFDIAVVSHGHPDHVSEAVVKKAKDVVESAGTRDFEGVTVSSHPTFHDESEGDERGTNLVSIVEAEGLRIAHLGDLGHFVARDEMPELAGVDVMLIPVGGHFTIDAETAMRVVEEFGPRIVVPMHFKTGKLGFPIAPVDPFTALADDFEAPGGSELEITMDTLPEKRTFILLDPAL